MRTVYCESCKYSVVFDNDKLECHLYPPQMVKDRDHTIWHGWVSPIMRSSDFCGQGKKKEEN